MTVLVIVPKQHRSEQAPRCRDAEHDPPKLIALPPGLYEYVCPNCKRSIPLRVISAELAVDTLAAATDRGLVTAPAVEPRRSLLSRARAWWQAL